jgi:hypothetical protein
MGTGQCIDKKIFKQIIKKPNILKINQTEIFLLFMSMGWDYVSELRPPTGLLSIPQLIYEYGELRWNDIVRGKPKSSEKTLSQCFCPPQIQHGLTRAQTRASGVRGRWLNACWLNSSCWEQRLWRYLVTTGWSFRSHKRRECSWLAQRLLASQDSLNYI